MRWYERTLQAGTGPVWDERHVLNTAPFKHSLHVLFGLCIGYCEGWTHFREVFIASMLL
jgi:hypothetical protein